MFVFKVDTVIRDVGSRQLWYSELQARCSRSDGVHLWSLHQQLLNTFPTKMRLNGRDCAKSKAKKLSVLIILQMAGWCVAHYRHCIHQLLVVGLGLKRNFIFSLYKHRILPALYFPRQLCSVISLWCTHQTLISIWILSLLNLRSKPISDGLNISPMTSTLTLSWYNLMMHRYLWCEKFLFIIDCI